MLKKRRSQNNIEQRTGTITFEPIARHRYSELVVRLSTLLYSRVNCGLRSVVDILEVVNDAFDGVLGTTPCYNTIENWVKKCGLSTCTSSGNSLKRQPYAQIIDESMMIGSEKLLLTLGIPAEHQGHPLLYEDVQFLDIAVAESWNGENIGRQLQLAAQKTGHAPEYVISDNASVMNKGVRCAGMKHHHDISHSLGMFMERTYKKEADFESYVKCMSEAKFKHNMKKMAYLLPPTQRTIARFLNLSDWVKWSARMLDIFHTLSADEREIFSFIPANASLIDELEEVMKCVKYIEHTCKSQGLSQTTILLCHKQIGKILLSGNSRMFNLGNQMSKFLQQEAKILQSSLS